MKRLPALALIAAACSVTASWGQTPMPADLTVCMQQNDPPLSQRAGDKPSGFDPALAGAIAQRLGRDVRIQWFVSRDDPDTSLPKDVNALLSDGRCQLVAEYPLTEGTLQPPHAPTAKLPPFEGAKPEDRTRWIKIGPLKATRPYRLDTLAVVLAPAHANREIKSLRDLDGWRVGVQIATLSDAIAMQYDGGRLDQQIVHLPDSRALFAQLQDGKLDAAFADLRAFDAWRLTHPASDLALAKYRHSIGFNMAFVGLASDSPLVAQVDTALADLQAQDAVAPMAAKAGLTFIPPTQPAVRADIRPTALNGD